MTMVLSTASNPSILSCRPGEVSLPCISRNNAGANVEATKDDFPEPETPVIATTQPKGIDTFIFWRLFSLAPMIWIHLPSSGVFLSAGMEMFSLPERYAPVILSSLESNSSNSPLTSTFPPSLPAPGPMSTSQSACLRVASSCSTTSKVFPSSVSSLKVSKRRSLSLGCKPILGSSRTYITPVNLVPI